MEPVLLNADEVSKWNCRLEQSLMAKLDQIDEMPSIKCIEWN